MKASNPNLVRKKVEVQGKKGTYEAHRWVKTSKRDKPTSSSLDLKEQQKLFKSEKENYVWVYGRKKGDNWEIGEKEFGGKRIIIDGSEIEHTPSKTSEIQPLLVKETVLRKTKNKK